MSQEILLQKIMNELKDIRNDMATKDDIKDMATKNDIKNMATKDDIRNMATKNDIKNMATKDDIRNMATKDDIKNMATKDDIKNMATKDDIGNMSTKDDLAIVQKDLMNELKKTNNHLKSIDSKQDIIYKQTGKLSEYHTETLARLEQPITKEDLGYFDKKIGEHDREIFKLKNKV